jgi:essential nuclear protein 1
MVDDYEELEIDEEDANVLDKFLPSAPKERRTLADLIMDKINEKNAADERRATGIEGKKDKPLVLLAN